MYYQVIDLRDYWAKVDEFRQVLDAREKERADRFKFLALRRNYILSHALLRFQMAQYLQIQAASIVYQYGPFGKPFLASEEIYFNMSHSMDKVLYGFSFDGEIGVDIEYIKPSLSIDELPLFSLSISEQNHIRALPIEKQKEAFYQFWTKQEAYLKALGTGLKNIPAAIPHSPEWSFLQPFSKDGYISSIAYRTPPLNS